VRQGLIELADKMGVGTVATNDVHFLDAEDYEAHNCLCCISTGRNADDPRRMIYPHDVYLKGPEQMREEFSEIVQACDNTLAIAERCNVEIDLKTRHAPKFNPPDGTTAEEFLTKLCYENAKRIYGEITGQIEQRLDRELEVIESKGFASYFLIVWDFCNFAHRNKIPVGARGSGVGTLVGYCLGLCDVDPIKYDLLFERFMDPQRNEMPDIDIDICQENRPRVIEYVRQKYGHVAQIITFGTMKARAVIRDVCRVKGVPLPEADRLAKLVPESLGVTIDDALQSEPRLKDDYQKNPRTREVIDICKKLEGLARHASVHAAGVVIADEPLTNFIPLYKASGTEDIITQFEGPVVEKVGLLKMDFLGLKTLSVLERAKEHVRRLHGREIDLEKIDTEDRKVFELFTSGKTKGIFQFESGGMQDMLMKMKPDRMEDLIAANALYRPGPMILIADYIERKHGTKWTLPHPIMAEILRETYGIMVYQEQVMRIANRLGDIPLREAYTMIKAVGKKNADVIASAREQFIAGCISKGLKKAQARQIFELIERFAGYGFNRSHSARYAIIAYQTAYMKTYWPAEFMAALLTCEMGNTDKVVEYIAECGQMGIEVLAPDINESGVDFTPLYKGHGDSRKAVIRFGLAAVKGVGEKAVEQIIAAREKTGKFQSLFHFSENVDLRAVNRQVIEALVKAGAFDRLGGHRAQMLEGLEEAVGYGSGMQADKLSGQMNLFRPNTSEDFLKDHKRLPNIPPWPEQQMLAYEKQVLGFYVTSNPLSQCAELINLFSTRNSSQLADAKAGQPVVLGGMVTKIRTIITKKGKNAGSKMAVFILEDLQGQAEVVLFPDSLNKFGDCLEKDKVVFVKGRVDRSRETPSIYASELIRLEQVREKLASRVLIQMSAGEITKERVVEIKSICQHHKGNSPVFVLVKTDKGRVHTRIDESFFVNPNVDFCREMKQIVGEGNFQLTR
jgi:DNA polymerase-3 subunit alpha